MIARFPGKCCYCGKPTKAGVDIYDVETRKNWHQACHDRRPVDLFASSEAEQLAAELGFIDARELNREFFVVPESWKSMSSLHASAGADPGRDSRTPHGQQDSLFGLPEAAAV